MALFGKGEVDEKMDRMRSALVDARDKLDKGDYPGAFDALDGMSDGTGCSMCRRLETNAKGVVLATRNDGEIDEGVECLDELIDSMGGE